MTVAYKNAKLVDIGTSLADVYVAPAATTTLVKAIHVSNKDTGNDQTFTVVWTDASNSNTAVSIATGHVTPQKASYQILDGVLVLEAGDKIRASAVNGSVLDVTVSVLENS